MIKNITPNEKLLEKILTWDLQKIVEFVVIENPDIPERDIRSSEKEYKYFIYLVTLTGENLSIPTKVVDLIWHAHILHTKDYIAFCDYVAGSYIHHTPYPYTEEKFEDNTDKVSLLSQQVFGNIVFDFNKKNLITKVNFSSSGPD
jgi:hypothetical protein